MTEWKCNNCGYVTSSEAPPGDTCPSCKEKCTWLNITCYIPECEPGGVDQRL
jgi:rubredoxin